MDLSYPIFKLESRAQYERERAAGGRIMVSGGSSEPTVYADGDREAAYKAACLRSAEACETAARILKQHQRRFADQPE